MRRLATLLAAAALSACAFHAAAATRATCEMKGSFDGADVPGAVASGEVEIGKQLYLDPFGDEPTYEVMITLTPAGTGATVAVTINALDLSFDLFLETTLGATVLSFSVDGGFDGRKLDSLSLLCREAR